MVFLKIPKKIKDDSLALRRLRIFDVHFLKNALKNDDILKSIISSTQFKSWLSLWWWIKKTYICSFCIELDSRPIGFIGLYNLIPRKSVEISLVIFDKTLRQKGLGTRAFMLLTQRLQRNRVAKKIFARVRTDNHIALLFWKKLGFVEMSTMDGMTDMVMNLNN